MISKGSAHIGTGASRTAARGPRPGGASRSALWVLPTPALSFYRARGVGKMGEPCVVALSACGRDLGLGVQSVLGR